MEKGVASRTSDIDIVLVHGYGFPRHLGGPLFWAQHNGPEKIHQMMKRLRFASGIDFICGDMTYVFPKQ